MGMDAEVIAIGPFSEAATAFLTYPADNYSAARPGTTIVDKVFCVESGSTSESCELARLVGVEAWDFNTHELDPSKADLAGLAERFDGVARFVGLAAAGFRFYYLPNG
ncbi:MAG: hypothetical protein K2X38_01970 [Gemmataceae bacterium]|nr:hypothetical protein [Gemmataceae bacterium]